MNHMQVFTIGHSTHPIAHFLTLLRDHDITAVADVRSSPYSRMNPQFNREDLQRELQAAGIAYVFLGKELGARSEDPACYEGGQVRYERLAKTELFKQGLQRVMKGAESHCVALMCAEKEPLDCHRTLLVSRALEALGVHVEHIRADGSLEAHGDTMRRLLALTRIPASDMFRSEEEQMAEACARQEKKIAYIDEDMQEVKASRNGDDEHEGLHDRVHKKVS